MKNRSRTRVFFPAALALWLCLVLAARAEPEQLPANAANSNGDGRATLRRGERPNAPMGPQPGKMLIEQLLSSTTLTGEIGLNPEATARMRDELHALQVQHGELESQISKLSLDQEGRVKRLLHQPSVDTGEIMKTIDEIGRLRAEQAKLTIQNLLVIRKYLSPEQIRKAHELLRDRGAGGRDGDAHPAKHEPPAAALLPKPSASGN